MRIIIFILTIFIIFSGCVEESKVTHSNESVHQGLVNTTPENLSSTVLSSKGESIPNIPEIEITSFSSIYMHDNNEKVYEYEYLFSWDNVPGNESYKLSEYLRNDQDISLEGLAQIVKSNDNKTISVIFSSGYSAELRLGDNKSNVLIIRPDLPDVELKVKEVNGKLFIYKVNEVDGYNITERYYAAYGLSIKNNGSKDLDFKLNELHVRDGDHIFNTTIEPIYRDSLSEVLSDLEKETKLEDTTLSPGQTINGSVVFQVNSLYNKTFLLMYNETPITSASFKKSIEALSTAERYNYSVIFGRPPYSIYLDHDSFELNLVEYPYIWANWVNRSIFEVFNKADIESFNKDVSLYMRDPSDFIHGTELVYALRVIPERNITVKTHFVKKNGLDVSGSPFKVVDDSGEELINSSRTDKIGILMNQTYELRSADNMDISQMNLSNVTIVRIFFKSGVNLDRLSSVNQNVIVDKEQNIVAASTNCLQFIS